MPRPRKCRMVQGRPVVNYFKPHGVPLHELKGVVLPVEGLEAIRLADAEGMDHEEAAALMNISRPTFSRILSRARATVAKALSSGFAIRIEGGDFEIASPDRPMGPGRGGHGRGRGGRGRKWRED